VGTIRNRDIQSLLYAPGEIDDGRTGMEFDMFGSAEMQTFG